MVVTKLFVLLFILYSTACATRSDLHDDYKSKLGESKQRRSFKPKKTAVLFLVDGLSYEVLKSKLNDGSLPNLRAFFLSQGQSLRRAHSVFPSLTFPNIASLLKEKPVDQTNALGNSLIYNNKRINFDNLGDRGEFSRFMVGDNIFQRLAQKNYFTVSLDYGLGPDASVASEFDFQSAYAVSQTDYRYIDLKKIDALKILLTETKAAAWPDFVFVHLVGLDFLSHKLGPLAKSSLDYLKMLDRDLGPVLSILKTAEKDHEVVTLLTADHGFALTAKKFFPLESTLQKIEPTIKVINESRMAALYFLAQPNADQLDNLAKKLLAFSGIEILAYKIKGQIVIKSRTEINYPYFDKNIESYFRSAYAADAVVIPNAETFFSNHGRGFHGGPTENETITPLLIRNALIQADQVPPIWELLKFIE